MYVHNYSSNNSCERVCTKLVVVFTFHFTLRGGVMICNVLLTLRINKEYLLSAVFNWISCSKKMERVPQLRDVVKFICVNHYTATTAITIHH